MSTRVSFQSVLSDALQKARTISTEADAENDINMIDNGSVKSDKSSLSSATYNKIMAEHNGNKHLWKNIIKDRDEIEIILNAIDLKSFNKLKTFTMNNPGSPIQEMDVFSNSDDEIKSDDFDKEPPRYTMPTVSSILPPSQHCETERVRNSYRTGTYNALKKLPTKLDSGEILVQKKKQVVENLLDKNVFKTSAVPRDNDFGTFVHLGTDYDKIHNLHKYFIEEEKMRIYSYSRRPFVVSSRIRSKFEDIFFDPSFRIPNLGPGGLNRKLESITRADLLDEEKYMYGRFNTYGGKMTIGENDTIEIKKWIHTIHETLINDWKDYTFRIKFTKTNELLIQFIKPDDRLEGSSNDSKATNSLLPGGQGSLEKSENANKSSATLSNTLPFPPPNDALLKYMNRFASHGVIKEFGLTKRGDRWNILEKEIVEEKSTLSNTADQNEEDTDRSNHSIEDDSSSHATNKILVKEEEVSPKRVKRFSLSRSSDGASNFFQPALLKSYSMNGRIDSTDSYDGGVPGGHIPPHNSVMYSGPNLSFHANSHEPPSQHQISNVLTGLDPNALHGEGGDGSDIQQLSDELISSHVAFVVKSLMGNNANRSRSTTSVGSTSSTSSTSANQGSRAASMKMAAKSVSFSNSVAENPGDDNPDSSQVPFANSTSNAMNSPSRPNPALASNARDLRKSILRASHGINTLQTMIEHENEDHSETLDQNSLRSKASIPSEENSTAGSNHHAQHIGPTSIEDGRKSPPIYIPPLENQLYRKVFQDKMKKEPKTVIYLTYSFYAPWVSTRQITVNRKKAMEDRSQARKFGQALKKKYGILPSLSQQRHNNKSRESLIDDVNNLITHYNNVGNGSLTSGSASIQASSTPGGQPLNHAISSMIGGKPRFSTNSADYEQSSLDAMVYGSRHVVNASYTPQKHAPKN